MRKIKIIAVGFSLLLLCTAGCRSIDGGKKSSSYDSGANDGMNGFVAREEATIATVKQGGGVVHVIAAGDNMVQTGVLNSAAANAGSEEEYNFNFCYEGAKNLLSGGDVKIIHQETLICDNDDIDISGNSYSYNSPSEVGKALIDTGFNAVSMGNNHLLDKGVGGLTSCLNYWNKMKSNYYGLITYGAYKNENDMNDIRVCEINGVKLAFLSYTDKLTSYEFLEESELKVVLLSDEEKIKAQIEKAASLADAVIVSAHWGIADYFEVSDNVKQKAQNMIDWGADVIIGTHPHVPQTMEYLMRPDGSKGFVFYSLGNFISAQTYNVNLIGEVAEFDVSVSPKGDMLIENIQVSPVISHFEGADYSNLRVIPYRDYTEELCNAHGLPQIEGNGYYGEWSMDKIKEIIDIAIPSEYQKLN